MTQVKTCSECGEQKVKLDFEIIDDKRSNICVSCAGVSEEPLVEITEQEEEVESIEEYTDDSDEFNEED